MVVTSALHYRIFTHGETGQAPIESLFSGARDNPAVTARRRGGIELAMIESDDVHRSIAAPWRDLRRGQVRSRGLVFVGNDLQRAGFFVTGDNRGLNDSVPAIFQLTDIIMVERSMLSPRNTECPMALFRVCLGKKC